MSRAAIIEAIGSREFKTLDKRKPEEMTSIPWDAPVTLQPLYTPSGAEAPFWAVEAMHGKAPVVVGQYRKESPLLPNLEAVENVRAAFSKLGWKYEEKFTMFRGGGGFEGVFTVLNAGFTLGHSKALPMVRIRNSYDGVWKFTGELLMKVLVCLNGMEGFAKVEGLTAKHSAKLHLPGMVDKFGHMMEDGKAAGADMLKLDSFKIADERQALHLFSNIADRSKTKISKVNAAAMFDYYLNPDKAEAGLKPTLWRAYMAGTRAMRDLAAGRPTVATEANGMLGQIMGLASRNASAAKQLLAPAKSLVIDI